MELEKKPIYMSRQNCQATVQVMVDADRNVPDARPDMGRIVMRRGEVEMEEATCAQEKAALAGKLVVSILYGTDEEKEELVNLTASVPFEETAALPGAGERDTLSVEWNLEDLTVEMVHSRKVRIQAALSVTVTASTLYREELIAAVRSEEPMEQKLKVMPMTGLAVQQKEIYRVREEVALAGNKPNILEIIWQDTRLGHCEVRPEAGRIRIRGELFGFVMYRAEDTEMPVQWSEFTIPFEGEIEVAKAVETMIPDIAIRLSHSDWEAAEDEDGEMRMLDMEGILELSLRLYEESEEEVVADLYSPVKEARLTEKEAGIFHILAHNRSSCKIDERVTLAGEEKILQICYGAGEVIVDEVKVMEDGLGVEGALNISLLYMSPDDNRSLRFVRRTLPYHYLVEARGVDKNCTWRIRPQLESLNFLMVGGEEAEVKASLALETMIFLPETVRLVTDVELLPYEEEKVRQQAGVVAYLVQPEDTLWKIAKKYYTTVERIYEINPGLAGEPEPGSWLLLMKQTEELAPEPGAVM